jgi:membrane fusion protein (multidrug efflux system)
MTEGETKTNRKKHGVVFRLFFFIVIIIAIVVGGHYGIRYIVGRILYESTDDAFVDGHIVSISPQVSGVISKVLVTDNQDVKEGDLLVTIDPNDYQARINTYEAALQVAKAEAEKAKSNISAAKAQANRAETDLKRYQELSGSSSVSKQDLDRVGAVAVSAQADLEVAINNAAAAQARIAQAHAVLEQARLELSYTRIYAPLDGRVAQKHAETGSFVAIGQPLMAIVSYNIWVTANFKETQLDDIHPGQNVIISVDAFAGEKFKGKVNSFQAGTGARFSLLPPENATGNYVKVVQRVPVKITFDEPMEQLRHLGLGMSVEPDVYVAKTETEHSWWLRLLKFLGGVHPGAGGDDNS